MSKNSETLGMFELKGADVDVDTFSASLESMIRTLFKDSHVLSCGQEQVILGKAYQPMVVLNELRVRTKMAFNDLGIHCEEINNHMEGWHTSSAFKKEDCKEGFFRICSINC